MIRYEPVPLPIGAADTSNTEIATSVHRWISARPMRDLVAAFDGTLPAPDTATGVLLSWLDRFSAEHWDFRRRYGQVERDEVPPPRCTAPTTDLIHATVTALGLVQPVRPAARRYHHLLVLGGLAPACLQRTGYAAQLVRTGVVEVGEVAALGSFRPLRPTEFVRSDLDGCGYEVDAMSVGIRAGFGCDEPVESRSSAEVGTPGSWAVRGYRAPDGLPLRVLAAPSGEPASRRANTADTYHFWARQVRLNPGDRVLVVTSPSYVPFQHCDAVRMLRLGYGCAVETVGFDTAQLTGVPPMPTLAPDRYLQEVRSAIRSMDSLYRALTPTTGG
ncbi:hypothetical protein BDK92_3822 [Micromonospora pisi]|uniref:Uncharacterized protein n=2 Tax=Micromonospora pisi TaxID=589240 RepID=A0A495JKW0_9ACTN|nr:hypothetical protein BDK92_3822 [Micromonospora pisi]